MIKLGRNNLNILTEYKCPMCIRGKMEFKEICGSVYFYECNICGHIEREKDIYRIERRRNKK